MNNLWTCFFIFTLTTAFGMHEDDIQVICMESSVHIMWNVNNLIEVNPARLFLGNCFPSSFLNTSSDEAVAEFAYQLSDCDFKRMATWKYVIYENKLTYRPLPKPNPPSFTYPVRCVYDRPKSTPYFQSPATGVLQGQGDLTFHMAILDNDFRGPAQSNFFSLGSFLPIWAGVDQQAHQPLVLLLEECVASTFPELHPDTPTYPIITNKGCLVDSKNGFSRFLPRYHSSSILLHLQTFRFGVGQEVYIHCKLIAWEPDNFNELKKACNYNKATGEWELLDDPSKNSLCQCCDSTCTGRSARDTESAPEGLVLYSVLGPLTITEDV